MRYFFHIAYQGQHYNGWQKQPGAISVQEVIEKALFKILKTNIPIVGCGRTDAHVHASQFFFHADIETKFDFDLLYRLNKTLPQNIAIFDIIQMDGLPHARFDAVQRKYDYFLHTYKDPFLANQSSFYLETEFNLNNMKKAVDLLPKYKDYRAFCTQPNKYEHTICNVMEADLFVNAKADRIRFHIASNRFLSKMIRILMGKLIKIGQGELSLDEFENLLINLETPKTLDPAHPTGLYLSKVTYPYLNLEPRTEFLTATQGTDWISVSV
ncbi:MULTISPECIES: tRNA pseudouridine(38-40) synthase TruA [Pedobacter]|uniref:tRNA pseudouridine synthase A n=1 Tax=Pedobacter agri TaxID=454586 RepID=A0A9X3I756_9SPHI|nr:MULTISPECIES: tRNA pseudouridine(38-40) synthase TruA [Pedobacter]AZI26062.1 tRNA pseudouridine(38-40) synthase TruA [Pedobacter sp. G11]MCX3263412.1 tRNA pseudouridine(38-40) synthase TruA [Pedobacter agri]